MQSDKLVILVLSCDAYGDLWQDFFNLRDKFWQDCPYKWYLVTETKEFHHPNVEIIRCGKNLNWAGRLRYAIETIDSQYYGLFLDDFFISERIDNKIIESTLSIMESNKATFLNMSDVFNNIVSLKEKVYCAKHLIIIPKSLPYGVSTEAAIWEKEYLLSKIGSGDYSAWQFEIDRVNEAKSAKGIDGFNLCDERMPFHVSVEPVVIQGKVYPIAKKYFKKIGYNFLTKRKSMTFKQVFLYRLKMRMSKIKLGKNILKWFATKFLGMKFFT